MFKLIRWLIVLSVLLVGAAILGLVFLDSLVVKAVEAGGSHALGVDTACGDADLGVMSGELELTNLSVDNPAGFRGDAFLTVARVSTELSLAELMGDEVIEVPRLTVDGARLAIEVQGGRRNYEAILRSIEKLKSHDAAATDGKRFIIRKLLITNTTISLDLLGGLPLPPLEIARLELKDVGARDGRGILTAEVAGVLVQSLLVSVSRLGGGILPLEVSEDLGARIGGVLAAGSRSWGELSGDGMGQDPLKGILKGVGDLLNRKKEGR